MEEEMIRLCNIMPVELAIKRELEYRAKMEVLKNQHQNDLKPLVLAQGPPPQVTKKVSEVAPNHPQRVPMLQVSSSSQMLKEKIAFTCKACQLTFASVFHLSSHVLSQLHKVNISQMKKRRVAISNPIWCELCRSSCSSLGEVEAHLNGSKHTSLLTTLAKKRRKH
ncbi:hypothetical protein M8C21_021195 [Ambrosia artemisiifolia]|uniref:C2H2-type domain-containing protein n=1 Tax=Ambrosia artemisiifolia TaxID=4212 RepID=A0AAD5D2L7_AMBAR|nr:hypothetical protein M8C21_021195 [Ambrosia artemisiifolia]